MQDTTVTLLIEDETSSGFVQVVATRWLTYFQQTIHIQFRIEGSPKGTIFLDDPIRWTLGQEPAPCNWGVTVDPSGTVATLWQSNVHAVPNSRAFFGFQIGVQLDGTTYYSPDPTIMNQGPVGTLVTDVTL